MQLKFLSISLALLLIGGMLLGISGCGRAAVTATPISNTFDQATTTTTMDTTGTTDIISAEYTTVTQPSATTTMRATTTTKPRATTTTTTTTKATKEITTPAPTTTKPYTPLPVIPLNQEQQEHIVKDYGAYVSANIPQRGEDGTVWEEYMASLKIEHYYNTYHETVVVLMTGYGVPTNDEKEYQFGNITLILNGHQPCAYRNGEFKSLDVAYQDGWLTDDDIRDLASYLPSRVN